MTQEQFRTFMLVSSAGQARDRVRAGLLEAEEAADVVAKQERQMLPNGLATPHHFFYTIEDADSGRQVGGFWLALMERRSRPFGFVMDIQIDPQYRRRGYATTAFHVAEGIMQEKGITEISLNVFGHNSGARALYRNLGYQEVAITMTKKIADPESAELQPTGCTLSLTP